MIPFYKIVRFLTVLLYCCFKFLTSSDLMILAIRRVIQHYSGALLPSAPSNIEKIGYGPIHLQKSAFLFDMIHMIDPLDVATSEEPLPMESVDQVRWNMPLLS